MFCCATKIPLVILSQDFDSSYHLSTGTMISPTLSPATTAISLSVDEQVRQHGFEYIDGNKHDLKMILLTHETGHSERKCLTLL
jgi:hypothetical protein